MKDKVLAIKSYNSSVTPVIRLGEDLQWCEKKATESCSRNGMSLVPPANDMDIILGQATAASELYDQVKAAGYGELDMVVAPCGGGSLLSGCVSWFQDTPTQVWGAEPLSDGPGLHASLKAGVLLPKTKGGATIADGQRTTISPEIWSILKDQTTLRGSIAVTEAQIRQALSWYYSAFGHVIEPSAAVAIAACASVVQQQAFNIEDTKRIGIILSGGNTSTSMFHYLSRGSGGH